MYHIIVSNLSNIDVLNSSLALFQKFAYLAFFDLILPLGVGWHIVTLIIVTALAASSIDTLQTGMASVFSSDLQRFGLKDNAALIISRTLLIIINIPAVIMATKRYDVIGLFIVADLVCATAVFPVFLGLITEDVWVFLPAPTEVGAFLGILSGMATVLINGAVNGFTQATNFITGDTIATGPFSYFWLTNEPECALCGVKTMVTFIIVPIVAGFFTIFFSKIDIMIRGERARKPLFLYAQPEVEAENYDLVGQKEEKEGIEVSAEPVEKVEGDGTSEEEDVVVEMPLAVAVPDVVVEKAADEVVDEAGASPTISA